MLGLRASVLLPLSVLLFAWHGSPGTLFTMSERRQLQKRLGRANACNPLEPSIGGRGGVQATHVNPALAAERGSKPPT